jgi:hypothetical protein
MMNKISTMYLLISLAALLMVTVVGSSYSAIPVFAEGNNNNNHDKDDFCDELLDEFEDLNDVINLDTAPDEQIDALEELRVFLVLEFDCVDEFEDFEWT